MAVSDDSTTRSKRLTVGHPGNFVDSATKLWKSETPRHCPCDCPIVNRIVGQPCWNFSLVVRPPGVEYVEGDTYCRTISIDGEHGVMSICPQKGSPYLTLMLSSVDTGALFEIVQRCREIFDLDAPIGEIATTLKRDESLKSLIKKSPGIRVPGAWDGFELTIRAILGQQISVKAATTLAGRIAEQYGDKLDLTFETAGPGLQRIFPGPERLMRARLNSIGLVKSRAETIRRVAAAVIRGDLSFDVAQEPEGFCASLTSIKGVGDWTAQYIAMRVLKNPDAFPSTDLGLLKGLNAIEGRNGQAASAELLRRAESMATLACIRRTVDMEFTIELRRLKRCTTVIWIHQLASCCLPGMMMRFAW